VLPRAAVIAHGVSPNDDFHQGLARALREKWPAMYKDFRHYSKTHSPRTGGLWAWMGADGQRIDGTGARIIAYSSYHEGVPASENLK